MNAFVKWLMSPLSEWHTMGLGRKLLAAGVGAGVGYYLHSKGKGKLETAAWSLGAAYLTAMLLQAAGRFSVAALPAGVGVAQAVANGVANGAAQGAAQGAAFVAPEQVIQPIPASAPEPMKHISGAGDEAEESAKDEGIFG